MVNSLLLIHYSPVLIGDDDDIEHEHTVRIPSSPQRSMIFHHRSFFWINSTILDQFDWLLAGSDHSRPKFGHSPWTRLAFGYWKDFFYRVWFGRTQTTHSTHWYYTRACPYTRKEKIGIHTHTTRMCVRIHAKKKRLRDVASNVREARSITEYVRVRVPWNSRKISE
jgi:hypothetical protein